MPICPHCSENKDSSQFYRNRDRKNNCSILCKPCFRAYEGAPDRRVKRTWNTLHARVRLQSSYDGIEVRMTRDAFLAWAIPEYTLWMAKNPGATPSLDRIDPKKHYELGNLRLLTRGENARLASNHPNVHAPAGMAWCGTHAAYLPKESFQKDNSAFNGLQQRCRDCQNEATRRSPSKSRRAPAAPTLEATFRRA